MSLINTVRATVLSIANKNNYGYITPNDFNLYAKLLAKQFINLTGTYYLNETGNSF